MSLHSSLKVKSGALRQHRNVLTRAERVEYLKSKEQFEVGDDSPIGMVKVANRKVAAAKKKPTKAAGGEEGAADADAGGSSDGS